MKRPSNLLTRGLITGLFGAAAVALWFFFLDFSDGHPFRSPAALGSALLFGASKAEAMQISFGVIAAYTLVHVIAFAVAGTIFVAIAEQVERSSSLVLLTVPCAIALEAVVVTGLALRADWVLGSLGVWSVLVANLLAVLSMGWYVWRTHPTLRHGPRSEADAGPSSADRPRSRVARDA
jgi:hypothetical protein